MRWHEISERACAEVLARLRADGQLNATQLGGARNGGGWWDWSETKVAVEWLLNTGHVICARRIGWRRGDGLPGRALPPEPLRAGPPGAQCLTPLAAAPSRALPGGT